MKDALRLMTDEEREAHIADIYRIFGADLDADEQAHVEELAEPTGIVWLVIVAAVASLGIAAWLVGAL